MEPGLPSMARIMASPFFSLSFTTSHSTVSPTTGATMGLDGDGNGAVVNVDVADHGGDDVAVSKGGSFAVFVFAFFGDDASWGDEARRHVSHSCCRHGPRWVAHRSLI